jgi:hypothetical protein
MTTRVRMWLAGARGLSGAKVLLGVIGLALLVVGVVKVLAASSASGVITLVIAGALLLVSPFIIDRLEGVSVSMTSFDFRFSREISELGAPKTAQILQRTLGSFVESYALIREAMGQPRYHEARVQLQDLLVERSAAIARREKLEASEVRTLFKNGSPLMRVLVVGLMQGDPSLADGATITAAIADARTKNEQYQGLRLAEQCWHRLPRSEQQAIRTAISSADIPPGSDRRPLADSVLSRPLS